MPGVEPRGVSRLIAHEERPDGLYGRLRVAETPIGDELLAEIRGGVREGVSVELSDVQYDPADPDLVVSARLDAVAHVPLPAYDSARVSALAASLNDPTGDSSVSSPTPVEPTAPAVNVAPALDVAQLAAALSSHLTAAAAPAGLPTGGALTAAVTPADTPAGVDQLASLQASYAASLDSDTSLRAALADITNSDLPIFQRPAGAIPQQLWQNAGYTRRFVPLLTQKPLVSYTFGGWEFTQRPQVDDWAGDKTQIPTGEVATREISGTAARIAGGWDVDRKYRDFGDSAFWSAFYAGATESYARKTDAKAAAAIIAAAQDVTATGTVPGYTRPTGYGTVAAQADILRAVAFGTAYLEDTPLVESGPDYVLMNTQDWLSLIEMTNLDLPTFLVSYGGVPRGVPAVQPRSAGSRHHGCRPGGGVVRAARRRTDPGGGARHRQAVASTPRCSATGAPCTCVPAASSPFRSRRADRDVADAGGPVADVGGGGRRTHVMDGHVRGLPRPAGRGGCCRQRLCAPGRHHLDRRAGAGGVAARRPAVAAPQLPRGRGVVHQ
jgi:hypothetical protein